VRPYLAKLAGEVRLGPRQAPSSGEA
jgi:hypothetical protein